MSNFGAVLIRRLTAAANRSQTVLDNDRAVTKKLDMVIPVLEKDAEGNQVALAAMREVYNLIERDAEASQSTITELKEAKDLLEKSILLLEQAGFDFDNIRTFSNDEVWLGDHLDTIKRFVEIVNIQKLEVALDEAAKERFEDIAHAVKRSGEKRQNAPDDAAKSPEEDAAEAALAAIDAIKVATELRDALVMDEGEEPESTTPGD